MSEIAPADDPLSPGEILFRQDLFSTGPSLSGAGERAIRKAGIDIGIPTAELLLPRNFPELRRRPDAGNWTFVLLHFRYDLKPLPTGREYHTACFEVEIHHAQAAALELHPVLITTSVDVERSRSVKLGPSLKFEGIGEFSAGDVGFGRSFRYSHLQPVITARGGGKPCFRWVHSAPPDGKILLHTRASFAVLQLPRAESQYRVTFRTVAEVARRRLGRTGLVRTDPEASGCIFRPLAGSFQPTT